MSGGLNEHPFTQHDVTQLERYSNYLEGLVNATQSGRWTDFRISQIRSNLHGAKIKIDVARRAITTFPSFPSPLPSPYVPTYLNDGQLTFTSPVTVTATATDEKYKLVRDDIRSDMAELKDLIKAVTDNQKTQMQAPDDCCICLSEKASRMFRECRHFCVCTKCADQLKEEKKCPKCRKVCTGIDAVYL